MSQLGKLIQNMGLLKTNLLLTEAQKRLMDLAWDDRSFRELMMGWAAQREEILNGVFGA